MIALLVMADGREDYLAQCIASARENLAGQITERWLYDETGDDAYRARLGQLYPEFIRIGVGPRRGFAGAIQDAWRHMLWYSRAEWVFHLEQDFTFNSPLNLDRVVEVIADLPYLVQMALRRQPWNDQERAAGGIVEQHPDDYVEGWSLGRAWLEHRRFFTTNPSLYRRSLCETGFHDPPHAEGMFTHRLLREGLPGVPAEKIRFGYWGSRNSRPWVEHIGYVRAGHVY